MNCPNCGKPTGGSPYCPSCGMPLEEEKREIDPNSGALGELIGSSIVGWVIAAIILLVLPVLIFNPITIYFLLIRGHRFSSISASGRKTALVTSFIYSGWLILLYGLGQLKPALFYPNVSKGITVLSTVVTLGIVIAFVIDIFKNRFKRGLLKSGILRIFGVLIFMFVASLSVRLLVWYNQDQAKAGIPQATLASYENARAAHDSSRTYASMIQPADVKQQFEKLGYHDGNNALANTYHVLDDHDSSFQITGTNNKISMFVSMATPNKDNPGDYRDINKKYHSNLSAGDWFLMYAEGNTVKVTPMTSISQIPAPSAKILQ